MKSVITTTVKHDLCIGYRPSSKGLPRYRLGEVSRVVDEIIPKLPWS